MLRELFGAKDVVMVIERKQYLSELIWGRISRLHSKNLERISKELDCTPNDLISFDDD